MKTLAQSQEDTINVTEKKSSNDKCCGIYKKSGIYKIVNKINQHYYVGRSNNFQSRWQAHRNKLRKGLHDNEHRKLVSQTNLNNTHALGKSHTDETKQKISNSLRNRNYI